MADTAFFIMFAAFAVYFVLGNYLYFGKVLASLDEPPKLLPSGQLKDIDRYLELIDGQRERRWFVPLLQNIRTINTVYLIGFAITAALIFFDS